MLRPFLALLAFAAAVPAWAVAPPMTVKDISLMARGGYPEAEIVAEVQKRRLAAPIDAATEKVLRETGTPATLIAKLKAGNFLPSPDEQAALTQKQAEQRAASSQREQTEAALLDQRRSEAAALAKAAAARDNVMRLLDGKLVQLQAAELRAYSATNLRDIRVFAFYFASNWSPKCREVTPAIIEWYRQTKAANPEFELIFVSTDRSELTMAENMRKNAMPFPAIRFDALNDPAIQKFGGSPTPWISAVSRAGEPVTRNLESKQFTDPGQIVQGIEYILAEIRKPGAKLRGE